MLNTVRRKIAFIRSSPSQEKLCYFLMFSIFLPYLATAAVLLVTFFYILVKKNYRSKVFGADSSKWLALFCIPLFLSPLFQEHLLGLAAGIGVLILLVIGIWISRVMKRHIFENCLNIAVVMSVPCALLAYAQKIYSVIYPGDPGDVYRSASVFMNPNYYGGVIEFISLICLYKFLSNKQPKRRVFYAAVLGINYIALYLSNSFSACAAIGIAAAAFLLFNRRFKALGAVMGLGVAIVASVLLIPDILPRMSFIEETCSVRMHIWGQAFNGFLQNPLLGMGTLGYWSYSAFETYNLLHQPHAHNILLDLLLNYGIVGTVSFAMIFIKQYGIHFKAALQSKYKPIGIFAGAVAVSVFVHGITDVTVLWHQTGLLLLFLLSGLSLVANEQEAESALRITSRMQRGLAGFEDAAAVRKQVFVVEQGFEEEFDEIDSLAWHVVLYDGDKPIATGRTFLRDGQFIIGRVAVCREYRRLHVGTIVIEKLEEKIEQLGGTEARLSAQLQAQGFYEKLGYHPASDKYHYEEHCPHIEMVKSLS